MEIFEVSGRVYTNLGELLDRRVIDIVEDVDFLSLCNKIVEDNGYHSVNLQDSTVKIRVDRIKKI